MFTKQNKILPLSFLLTLGVVLTVTFACNKSTKIDKDALAQINDLKVTDTHFLNRFKEVYYRTGQVLSPDQTTKRVILENTFGTYVMATFAKDKSLDKTREAHIRKEQIQARVLTEEYQKQIQLAGLEVSNKEVSDYFIRFNSVLRASHLYAPTLEEAQALRNRLNAGEKFEDLAKEVFQNPYLVKNGGDVGPFTTDEMDIAFEEAAFGLKVGEISEPVQTAQGYSIIKLTDRYTKPILTEYELANRKPQIESYVLSKKEELKTRELLNNFMNDAQFNEKFLDELWDELNPNYAKAIVKEPEFIESLKGEQILLEVGNYNFTKNDFAKEFLISTENAISSIEDKTSFKNFVVANAYRAFMVDEAIAAGLDKQESVRESIQETYLNYLSDAATEYLRKTIQNTEAELRETFMENSERFYTPLHINLARIEVDSEELAENLLHKLLDEGASFTEMVKKHSTNFEDVMTEGVLGYENIKNYGFTGTKLAALEVGEISEIIHNETGKYQIYKCLGKEEATPQTFEEAKDEVDSFLTDKKLSDLKASTIEDVKKQHQAVVDTLKLKNLTIQI